MATQHDDVELEGILLGHSAKAYHFQADIWDKGEWIPRSQSELVMHPDSDTPGAAVIYVRRWLARKNNWVEE